MSPRTVARSFALVLLCLVATVLFGAYENEDLLIQGQPFCPSTGTGETSSASITVWGRRITRR